MHRIIAGGSGLVSQSLIAHWLSQGHTITVLSMAPALVQNKFGSKVKIFAWDKITSKQLSGAELIVNLTGADIGAKRWDEAYKKEMLSSRVGSTKKIAQLLAELDQPPVLFNASNIHIYGFQDSSAEHLPEALDEDTPIHDDPSKGFLPNLAYEWEKAAEPLLARGGRIIFLRIGVVLAKEGGILPNILQLFHYYLGGSLGSGKQAFSWISIHDVLRAVDFLAELPDASGPYNLVTENCVMHRELADTLSRILDRPDMFPLPNFVLHALFGKQKANELFLQGERVFPKRLLAAGFKFSYPDLESAINHILRSSNSSAKRTTKSQTPAPQKESWLIKIKKLFNKQD